MNDPSKREQCEREYRDLLPLVSDYVDLYALKAPARLALIEHDTGESVTYKRLAQASDAFAAKLSSLGLGRGDVVATSLPFTKEHVFLEYACFKLGIVIAPLDLRLKAGEITEAFAQILPKAYFFLGQTPRVDFRPIVAEVMKAAPSVQHWVQFQKEPGGVLEGAVHVREFARDLRRRYLMAMLTGRLRRERRRVGKRDPALIIFTTGSTGKPKPAMLCHENILVQNIGLAVGFEMVPDDRMLVNLPPSHVGGQTEQLMTVLFGGGTAVLLHVFDPEKSLQAIAEHRVTMCGQIPALFNLEWRLPSYDAYDLSTLRFAIYGGQTVDRAFLTRLGKMAKRMGTGLGLTETAGFCTYTPPQWTPAEVADSIGFDSPLCPISVRAPMLADGRAGASKPAGEMGEICFSGPQVFLGYMNYPEATRRTLSSDGVCYTGDLGRYDERGLHRPVIIAGLGTAALLAEAGIDGAVDLDWWQSRALPGGVRVTAVPVQHWSRRGFFDGFNTLWAGFVVDTSGGPVYFAGDTGWGPHFELTHQRFGPMRLAVLPVGSYLPRWFMGEAHVSPREAAEAHRVLGSRRSVAMHFGTFPLADDGPEQGPRELRAYIDSQDDFPGEVWVLGFGEGRDVPPLPGTPAADRTARAQTPPSREAPSP